MCWICSALDTVLKSAKAPSATPIVSILYRWWCIAHGCLIVFHGSLAKILNFVRQRDNYLTANHNEARITVLVVLV